MPRPKAPRLIKTQPDLEDLHRRVEAAQTRRVRRPSPSTSSQHAVTNSDDSDGLVVTTKARKTAQRSNGTAKEFMMQGALGSADSPDIDGRSRVSKRTIEDMTRVAREAQHTIQAKGSQSRRAGNEIISRSEEADPSSLPTENSRTHMLADTITKRPLLGSRRPSLVTRAHLTPLVNNSVLGHNMFKKRARQPSLLRALGNSVPPSPLDLGEDSLDDDSGMLDDFRPDDESTPLTKPLTQIGKIAGLHSAVAGSRKRKLKSPEVQVPVSLPPSQSRSLSASTDSSTTIAAADAGDNVAEGVPYRASVETEDDEPHISVSPVVQIYSDTMAPPESSTDGSSRENSPLPTSSSRRDAKSTQSKDGSTPSKLNTKRTTRAATKTKPLTTAALQNLLPRRRVQNTVSKSTFDFSTSSDVEAGGRHDEQDENADESSFMLGKAKKRNQQKSTKPIRPGRGASKAPQSKTSKVSRTGRLTHTTAPQQNRSHTVTRTYSRKSDVAIIDNDEENDSDGSGDDNDNEDACTTTNAAANDDTNGPFNQRKTTTSKRKKKGAGVIDDEDDNTAPEDGHFDSKAKAEMARLARKFQEVDDFELAFEDMTGQSGSSQMRDAR